MKIKYLYAILLFAFSGSSALAAGCTMMLGSTSSYNADSEVNITATASGLALLPSTDDALQKSSSAPVSYWVKNENKQTRTVIFLPEGSTFQPDSSNSKGWQADSTIPGLFFTLSANLTPPSFGYITGWKTMPIYLSNNTNVNQSLPASALGCSSISNPTKVQDATAAFTLTLYTTTAFDPAKAAGKQIFTTRQKAGVVKDKDNKGGALDVYISGPITISASGCGAFNAEKKVDLGELNASELRAKPDGEFNNTPFKITLNNCYAKPSLIINVSNNQIKNNLLANTNGQAGGVGIGLGYKTATTSERLDMTKAVTIDAANMNYTDNYGNGALDMYAFLGVTDTAAISGGSVDVSAIITLSHP